MSSMKKVDWRGFISSILITSCVLINESASKDCKSKYSPYMKGVCVDVDDCTGGPLNDGCSSSKYIKCCVPASTGPPSMTETLIERFIYLEINGEKPRTEALFPFVNKAMKDAGLETCHQKAVFISELVYTTSFMKHFEENNDGQDYEGDVHLGNTNPGDGRKYISRGMVPIIGRNAYKTLSAGIKQDLIKEPELLALPATSAKAAAWLWMSNYELGNLKDYSDGTRYNFVRLAFAIMRNMDDVGTLLSYWEYISSLMECPAIEGGMGKECRDKESGDIGYCKVDTDCKGEMVVDEQNCGIDIPSIKCCLGCKTPVDLVFAMDASGSIQSKHFNTEKKFVRKIVQYFDISETSTRVAVINYSDKPNVIFNLVEHMDKANALKAIGMIPYKRGGTRTDLALLEAHHKIFNASSSGVRAVEQGIPRILVILTDGKSNKGMESLKEPVRNLKELGVNTFAIGVGNDLDNEELNLIATDPDKDHVYQLKNFDEVVKFIGKMSDLSCYEPALLYKPTVIRTTIGKDEERYYKFVILDGVSTVSAELTDEEGRSMLYVSLDEKNPGPKTNKVSRVSSSGRVHRVEVDIPPRVKSIVKSEDYRIVYMTVKGTAEKNTFQFETFDGKILEQEENGSSTSTSWVIMLTSLCLFTLSITLN